jgi:hypothetical protein
MAYALVLIASVLAFAAGTIVSRRRVDAPTQARVSVPTQLDRTDFDFADVPWLVVVFSSTLCDACELVAAKAQVLLSESVGVQVVSFQDRADLHARYAIDGVPLTVVADIDGTVQKYFVGAVTATDLWAAVAALRDPSQRIESCANHD